MYDARCKFNSLRWMFYCQWNGDFAAFVTAIKAIAQNSLSLSSLFIHNQTLTWFSSIHTYEFAVFFFLLYLFLACNDYNICWHRCYCCSSLGWFGMQDIELLFVIVHAVSLEVRTCVTKNQPTNQPYISHFYR